MVCVPQDKEHELLTCRESLSHFYVLFMCPCYCICDTEPISFFLTEAVNNIVKFLGMQPCERSDKVPDNKNSHTLYLAGELWGKVCLRSSSGRLHRAAC